MVSDSIYLDYAATTPTDPQVVDSMLPYFLNKFGNPSSRTHNYGLEAYEAIKIARVQISDLIGVKESEDIVFTSGATEAINLALKGVYDQYNEKGNHIITSSVEHKAVLDTCKYLEKRGATITYLPVDSDGLINLDELKTAITPETILISIIYVNNETGVIQPIKDIASVAKQNNILFMTDATQALGRVYIDVEKDGIDLLACSSHKIYGPNGVGALYIKTKYPRTKIVPQIHGGGQERGYRSGTLNTPGIVGFGKAASLLKEDYDNNYLKLKKISDSIIKTLKTFPGLTIHAENANKVPHIISFFFEEIDAEGIIIQLKDRIALSVGSACTSQSVQPSHVIMAMHNNEDIAYSTLRISIGRYTEDSVSEEIHSAFKYALEKVNNFL